MVCHFAFQFQEAQRASDVHIAIGFDETISYSQCLKSTHASKQASKQANKQANKQSIKEQVTLIK
jgi:Zn ribbon nucleic-acid-binding protein